MESFITRNRIKIVIAGIVGLALFGTALLASAAQAEDEMSMKIVATNAEDSTITASKGELKTREAQPQPEPEPETPVKIEQGWTIVIEVQEPLEQDSTVEILRNGKAIDSFYADSHKQFTTTAWGTDNLEDTFEVRIKTGGKEFTFEASNDYNHQGMIGEIQELGMRAQWQWTDRKIAEGK